MDLPPDRPLSSAGRQGFGELVRRAIRATNATPRAVVFVLLFLAPQQIVGVVAATLLMPDAAQFEPGGNPFRPEMLVLMAIGFANCGWFFVELFGLPWVFGGAAGQLRDRLAAGGEPAGPFGEYGRRYYGSMLGLFALAIAATIAAYVPVFGGTIAFMASKGMNFGAMNPAQMQAFSRHPATVALSLAYLLAVVAVGTVAGLGMAVAVVENRGPIESLQRAFWLCRHRFGDVAKLFGIFVAVYLPVTLVSQIGNVLGADGPVWLIGMSVVNTVYLSYAAVLNLAIAVGFVLEGRSPVTLTNTSDPASGS